MGRRSLLALVCLAALIAGFTSVASACRVRRPPSVSAAGIPEKCSDDFTLHATGGGNRRVESMSVRLDSRTIASARDDRLRVRVPCRRLSPGLHRIQVSARNNIGRGVSRTFTFTAR
jgi:hypothetical protein